MKRFQTEVFCADINVKEHILPGAAPPLGPRVADPSGSWFYSDRRSVCCPRLVLVRVPLLLFLLPPQLSFQQFHHCWWFQLINLDTAHFVPEEKHLFCWSRNKDIPVRKTCWQLLIHGGGMLHKNCTSVNSVRGVPFSATIKNIFFTWPVIFQHLFSCIQKWLSASPFCENSKGRGRKYDRGLVYYTWSDLHVRQWGLFLMCGVVFVPGGFSGFFLVVLSLVISV